jgi:RHS repeat-associated protein
MICGSPTNLDTGQASYTYDANGSRISKTSGGVTTTYSYNADNLLSATSSPSLSTSYAYDGDNQRISATEDGSESDFVLDPTATDELVLQESQGETTTTYAYGAGLISRETQSGVTYLLSDGQGSVRLECDESGDVTKSHSYDAYGIEQGTPDFSGNRFRYTGEWSDGTGLVFLRARFYDPETGAFLSVDPKPSASSRYLYCADNPLVAIDPSGCDWKNWATDKLGQGFNAMVDWYLGAGTSEQHRAAMATWLNPAQWVGSFVWSLQVQKHPKLSAVSFCVGAGTAAGVLGATGLLPAAIAEAAGTGGAAAVPEAERAAEAESAGGGTTLFRAVGLEEAADLEATGTYRIAGKSAEGGKYFYPTQEQAQAMVDRGWATHVTSATFPQEAIDAATPLSLPTEGPGLFIPREFFPYGPVEILGGPQ